MWPRASTGSSRCARRKSSTSTPTVASAGRRATCATRRSRRWPRALAWRARSSPAAADAGPRSERATARAAESHSALVEALDRVADDLLRARGLLVQTGGGDHVRGPVNRDGRLRQLIEEAALLRLAGRAHGLVGKAGIVLDLDAAVRLHHPEGAKLSVGEDLDRDVDGDRLTRRQAHRH